MGKTATIKQRLVSVYLPSLELKQQWETLAQTRGVSLSKFVIGHVEHSLEQSESPHFQSRDNLWHEVRELREQLDKALQTNRVLELAIERLEVEVRRHRAQPFLDEQFVGLRRYSKAMVRVLRDAGRPVRSDELLARLGIALGEEDAVKAIAKQLELLEEYGLVHSSPKGWKWVAS